MSLRVLISVGKRVRAQTFGQGPQDRFKLRQNEVTSHGQLDIAWTARMLAWKQLFIQRVRNSSLVER